ncbi:hypothetical protein GGR56DRAFT_636344 [Xylariaceae sp. FL0804]|nr:hypothetical protein GGR56DRAFT_636344 [Xylariaceae sp. FL0804]
MGLGAAALAVAAVPCYALARRSPSRAAYMAVLGAELASGVVFTLAFFFQSGLASRLADGALTAGAAPTATRLGPGMYAGMAALAAQLAALTSCFYVTIGGAERYNNQHHQHHHRQQEEGAVRCIGPRSPLPYARSPRLDGGEQSPLMVVMMEDRETGTLCEKKEESVRDGELV